MDLQNIDWVQLIGGIVSLIVGALFGGRVVSQKHEKTMKLSVRQTLDERDQYLTGIDEREENRYVELNTRLALIEHRLNANEEATTRNESKIANVEEMCVRIEKQLAVIIDRLSTMQPYNRIPSQTLGIKQ
jgi:uncharacterized coiled-coil protein SlyX